MGKIFAIIAGLLATVVIAAITVTIHETEVRDARKHEAMFEIAPAAVDAIVIEGPSDERLVLARRGDGWVLPDLGDFPADAREVDDMLTRLLAVESNLPLGSGAEVLRRYKLADDDFERRVTLRSADETLATLYLGTPEGPRQVHLRRAGDATAYSVPFGLYDASFSENDWFDRGFLQVAADDIASIEVNGLRLVHEADKSWRLDATDDTAGLQPGAAAKLAGLLAGLRVESFLADETVPDYALDTPQLLLTLTRKDGTRIEYRLGKTDLQKDYSLKVSTRPEHFHLSVYAAHKLLDAAGRDALLAKPAAGQNHAAAAGKATLQP